MSRLAGVDYAVEPYRTPAGYLDFPFVYVFDARSLTDGNTYYDINLQLQGDSDFVLRRITGIRTVLGASGQFRFRGANGAYAMSAPVNAPSNSRVVLPERIYPYNTGIRFDLLNVTRQSVACADTIYTSFLAFQGVKRFIKTPGVPTGQSAYRYREYKWAYPFQFTLSSFAGSDPVRFIVPINDFDFELQRIAISYQSGAAVTDPDFGVTLYDPNRHAFSNLPLNVDFVNNAFARFASQKSVFPVPPIVYPTGSQIIFDITSYLCETGGSLDYDITFDGLQRLPC